jgi:hypothetical protein
MPALSHFGMIGSSREQFGLLMQAGCLHIRTQSPVRLIGSGTVVAFKAGLDVSWNTRLVFADAFPLVGGCSALCYAPQCMSRMRTTISALCSGCNPDSNGETEH